jgi:LPS-assembly protein
MKASAAPIVAAALLATTLSASAQTTQPTAAERFARDRDRARFSLVLPALQPGGEVRWTAEHQELVRDEYVILRGEVKIHYQDLTLSADKITYNFRTKDATAEGGVIVDQGPARLSGERAVFNLESKTGTFFKAKGSFEPSVYVMGEQIEKLDDGTYRITDGVFTSCDINDPSWSFRLGSGIVTVDDYAHLRSISFRAKKVPIIWLPYVVWPTKRERSQGLLIPRVGFSTQFGSYVGNSYFVPIGDSYDATLYADYYSEGFHGAGTQIRYRPSLGTDGKLMGHAVRDPDNDTIEWKYEYQHTQDDLPFGFRGVIDIRDFSDLEFFKRWERDFRLNTLSSIYSAAYLTKNDARYSINLRTDRREHFLGSAGSQVFEQLPALEFRSYPTRVAETPFYFAMESSASHLRTSLGANYYRTDIFPTLSMQLRTPPWLSVKPQLSLRETWYTSSLDPSTRQITEDSLSRFYAQGQVEVVGPSFSKIYDRPIGGFARFKHVIEPRARYVYTSDVEDQNRVIRFDTVDSPLLPIVRDSVEYSLTQRVIAKESGENASAREILSVSLRQSVALSDPFESSYRFGTNTSRFSPLLLNVHYNPYQTINVDANATFGADTRQLDQTSVSAHFVRPASQTYLGLTWFSVFERPGFPGSDSSQLRVSSGGPLWKEKIRADVWVNYDVKDGAVLEQRYITSWFSSCYNIAFEYRDFLVRGSATPNRNRDYQISINLKNVGTFVDLRGSLDNLF